MSTALREAAPSSVEAGGSARQYRAVQRVSYCPTGEKSQDRADADVAGPPWFAALCDGATQSMRSAEAAEIISSNPAELWVDGVLSERVKLLRRLREELMVSQPSEPVDETSFLSRAFAEIVRDKQRQAFQTTLVAVRITPLTDRSIRLDAKICGDCALLVFDRRGRLVRSNLQLENESAPFDHASPLTEVLPDHFQDEEPNFTATFDDDAHIILCSDGFYDAFSNPSALFRWLLLNGTGPEDGHALHELHALLDRHRGDDDISFIWFFPCASDVATPESSRGTPYISSSGRLSAACSVLLRRFGDWIARFGPTLSGGIAS